VADVLPEDRSHRDTAIEIVLFDLGGVLVDFGGVEPMRRLSRIDTEVALWQRWLTCPWVRSFESGRCSADEFALGVVDEWDLALSPDSFLEAFAGWPVGPFVGADELVEVARRTVAVGCLSNTNALQWDQHAARWSLVASFDYRFLSFELGAVKPDAELFERVGQLLPTPPDRVLFLDDNTLNVEAAAAAGFVAAQVRGVTGARRALIEFGVLGSESY
jgi:putative hydrolase of the HAD superfamily